MAVMCRVYFISGLGKLVVNMLILEGGRGDVNTAYLNFL